MKNNEKPKFDFAVIGGGPAGLIASGKLAERGASVVLIEKNSSLGNKLLLTGNGRCNLTNSGFTTRELINKYKEKGKFLWHAFSIFGPDEVAAFFNSLGIETKLEGNKVFPKSDKASEVLAVLENYCRKNKVNFMTDCEVLSIEKKGGRISKIKTTRGDIVASNYVFCTGGASYPQTGSDGSGFHLINSLGHKIENRYPALTPIIVNEQWVRDLAGVSIADVEIFVLQNGKKKATERGDILFTHFGFSGPAILNISGVVSKIIAKEKVNIRIDFLPNTSEIQFEKEVMERIVKDPNKTFQRVMTGVLTKKLIAKFAELSGFDPNTIASNVTKKQRYDFVSIIKKLELSVAGVRGLDEAMVTSGGVLLSEIDDKTMKSKIIDNLFFAGEILGIDGPTGGFNLQVCWSTGFIVGENL